jgi:hypothetical protein
MPTPGVLKMTLEGVMPRNSYHWVEDKMVVEVQFCYRLQNVGPKAVPKWDTSASFDLSDDELGKRFVTREEFPRIGSGPGYYRRDSTILPTLDMTTEHILGVIVRRSEKFDEMLPRILNATTVSFWPVTDDGQGEKTTVALASLIEWEKLQPGFRQSYDLALGRMEAE